MFAPPIRRPAPPESVIDVFGRRAQSPYRSRRRRLARSRRGAALVLRRASRAVPTPPAPPTVLVRTPRPAPVPAGESLEIDASPGADRRRDHRRPVLPGRRGALGAPPNNARISTRFEVAVDPSAAARRGLAGDDEFALPPCIASPRRTRRPTWRLRPDPFSADRLEAHGKSVGPAPAGSGWRPDLVTSGLWPTGGAITWAGPLACDDFGRTERRRCRRRHPAASRAMAGSSKRSAFAPMPASTAWGANTSGAAISASSTSCSDAALPAHQGGILFTEDVNEHPYRSSATCTCNGRASSTRSAVVLGAFQHGRSRQRPQLFAGTAIERVAPRRRPVLGGLPFDPCRRRCLPVGARASSSTAGIHRLVAFGSMNPRLQARFARACLLAAMLSRPAATPPYPGGPRQHAVLFVRRALAAHLDPTASCANRIFTYLPDLRAACGYRT